jgi:Xaa-Pro dipeptidase
MLQASYCRARQQRVLRLMQDRKLDAVVAGWRWHSFYLSGHRAFWQNESALVLFANGRSLLVSENKPDAAAAADENLTYQATFIGTHRTQQAALAADQVIAALASRGAARIGVDSSAVSFEVCNRLESDCISIDPDLWEMRRRKDPDELAILRKAIDCTAAMHQRARQIIEPGIPELKVFSELHAAAVQVAGEPLSDILGNDYACGTKGGPPRKSRVAQAGELYILDLGPAVSGYFADNSRAYSVNRKVTDAQHRAWEIVTGVFPIVESMSRPGVRCRDIFAAVDDYYRQKTGSGLPHHLGHGVGLRPHEFPHLNPHWDDVLSEGEVFTCEPGLYGEDLGGGMRLENQYLVTAGRLENLTPFPMELA